MWRDLGFTPDICGTEARDSNSVPPSLLIPGRNHFIKNPYPAVDRNRDPCEQSGDSAKATVIPIISIHIKKFFFSLSISLLSY